MTTQTIIDNPHVKLFYETDTKIVHHRFAATIHGDYLMESMNKGVELLKQHKATKWLSDNRAINGHSEKETEWINNVWLPSAINAGWKAWALVVPDSFLARINMNEFVKSFYDKGVRIMVFTDWDEAMNWLKSL